MWLRHLDERVIKSFSKASTPRERNEALPVPAAAVVDWESRVVHKDTLLGEILFLGALLLLVWAGLRFGDLQRSNFSALSLERGILRGNSWRTKVADAGQPWGGDAFGLSGRPPNWGWAHVWFAAFATLFIKALNTFRATLARVRASLGLGQASARVMAAACSLHLKVAV